MLVSVIIPVYNSESTICRCIESVVISLERVTQDYEIICVDDGSADNSLHLLNEIASQNSKIIVVHQENAGAATARNKGLELAKGEYIAFNDSDDEWLEDHFEVLLNVLKNHPEIDCLSGNHEMEKQKTQFIKKIGENLYKTTLKSQLLKNYFSPQNSILKHTVWESGIKFSSGMRHAEEGFFFNWIAKDFNACFINQKVSQSILGKARFGESGLSGNLKAMEKGELFNIHYAYENFGIPFYFYLFTKIFSLVKYVRRILIVKIRNLKGKKNA
ncbi:MAG: glycosyltransferase family 2 protein [Treponema sp.]|nr:glycosyltransferase family 2 protein [Treponema sp.]